MTANSELFGNVLEYPDPDARARYDGLVGLDETKRRLVLHASVLIDPSALDRWSDRHYGRVLEGVAAVSQRTPLLVLAGDVGTGKTELAESVGDAIARDLALDSLTLYPLSLSARGRGLVGEMTTLITQAFDHVRASLTHARGSDGRLTSAAILLVDEADSVAQSRELSQMHHEDRAGVNALIRGIDSLRRDRVPVLTIMCTNRADALDPAVARRSAEIFEFERPSLEQRLNVLTRAFAGTSIDPASIVEAAELLGPSEPGGWGATYSDLRQRFIPNLMLGAYGDDVELTGPFVLSAARSFTPTRPFGVGA